MKKSLLALVALAAIGLTACGEKPTPTPDPGPDPAPVVDVPTEEGKCTFYFTMADASVALNEYESIYLTGGFISWAEGYNALTMQKLGDTKVYYAQIANDAFDVTKDKGCEYQLSLGYNDKSKMPDDKVGMHYEVKSDECAAPGDLNNLSFEYSAGALSVNLGTHTFSSNMRKPADPLKNYTFKVEFAEAVPEYGKVLIFGSFNNWQTPGGEGKTDEENKALIDAAEMTANEDRTVFTKTFAEMYANNYECKILVEYTTAVSSIAWNAVDQTKENYSFSITQADGDNYTLDILGEKATYKLADPNKTVTGTITVVNSGEALTATDPLMLIGDFTNWTAVPLTKVDNNTYTLVGDIKGGNHEFGVMTITDGWKDAAVSADGKSNAAFSIEIGEHTTAAITFSCDFSLFGGAAKHPGVVSDVVYDAVE